MAKNNVFVAPSTARRLKQLGEQIKYARLRRRLSVTLVAERAGMGRSTVYSVEAGSPRVSIAAYAGVMMAIGMPDEITKPCREDLTGRDIQDSELKIRRRSK